MELDRDFSEFIACCAARDVRFLIVGGYAVPFIDVDHLILNKRASGRLQDLADAEALTGGDTDPAG